MDAVKPWCRRTYSNKGYEKLGVNNRRSVVRRADELDLLQGNR